MTNIKCEWCGVVYNLDNSNCCPSCGAKNETISAISEISQQTFIKEESKTKNNTNKFKEDSFFLMIVAKAFVFFIIIILTGISCCIEELISFF